MSSCQELKDDMASIPFDARSLRERFYSNNKRAHWTNETSGLVEVRSEPQDLTASVDGDIQEYSKIDPYSLFSGAYAVIVPPEVEGVNRTRLIRLIMNDQAHPFAVEGFLRGSISESPNIIDNPSMSALASQLEGIDWNSGEDGFWELSHVQLDDPPSDPPSPSADDQGLVPTKATNWAYIGRAKLKRSIGAFKVTWETPVLARMYTGTSGQGATISDEPDNPDRTANGGTAASSA